MSNDVLEEIAFILRKSRRITAMSLSKYIRKDLNTTIGLLFVCMRKKNIEGDIIHGDEPDKLVFVLREEIRHTVSDVSHSSQRGVKEPEEEIIPLIPEIGGKPIPTASESPE